MTHCHPARGGANLWVSQHRDRCRPFARNISNLNTESPPPGGGQMSAPIKGCVPAPLSRADFFLVARNFRAVVFELSENSRIKSKAVGSAAFEFGDLFSRAVRSPGGGQKSGSFRLRTGGPATRIFSASFRKLFFGPRAVKVWHLSIADRWPGTKTSAQILEKIFFRGLHQFCREIRGGGGR